MREELELENKCRAYARTNGWVACKLEKNGNKGVPDDLFISPQEVCLLVEFKKDASQKLRPEQKLWRERFPHIVHVISDFGAFTALLSSKENGE